MAFLELAYRGYLKWQETWLLATSSVDDLEGKKLLRNM